MADVVHGPCGQLLSHPFHIVGVALKQGHLGRRQRKLQPALGLGSRHRTVQEGGTATEGQQQGILATQQPQRREDLVGLGSGYLGRATLHLELSAVRGRLKNADYDD